MLSLSLGPLVLPMMMLPVLATIGVYYLVGWWLHRYRAMADVTPMLSGLLLAGALSSRIGFVLRWHQQYLADPWSIINIRDGGFMAPDMIVGVLLYAAWCGRGAARQVLRKPLGISVLAGLLAWGAGNLALAVARPAPAALPAAVLRTLDGAPASLAGLAQGRPLVLNLWASWCPPCRREMPVLAAAQQARSDIVFVYANQREEDAAVNAFLASSKFELQHVLLDAPGALGREAGSSALPITLFYDAQGRLQATHLGELSSASLASKLRQISAQR